MADDFLSSLNPVSFSGQTTDELIASRPGYLVAADNHNLAHVGSSWFDVDPGNIPKFAAVAALSGLNSFYSTGVAIGNFFGLDVQERTTDDWINSIDSDLGEYYTKNQGAADLAGFIGGSIIPGIGGVKILNAGQKALAATKTGLVGTNIGRALGLQTPKIDTYITLASKEIVAGQAAFSNITQSGFKAIAAGVYQNVLEGMAFEVAVQATMQKSPILSEQSNSDILWNVATGGFLNGVIGGAFKSAQTYGAIQKGVRELFAEKLPFGSRNLLQETGQVSDKLILLAEDMETTAIPNPGDPAYATKVAALEARQTRIALAMREAVHELTSGTDKSLGRMFADMNVGQSSDDMLRAWVDTVEVARMTAPTMVEKQIAEAVKSGKGVDPSLIVQYAKLTGEGAGVIYDQRPLVINLADRFVDKGGAEARKAILLDVSSQGFKPGKYWDARTVSLGSQGHLDAERRYIWADMVMQPVKEGAQIGHRDIPVLERVLKDAQAGTGTLSIKLVDKTGAVLKDGFTSTRELNDYLMKVKKEVAYKLQRTALKTTSGNNALGLGDDVEKAAVATNEKIAKITNTRVSALEAGIEDSKDPARDYFAWQQLQEQRNNFLRSKGLKPVEGEENDPRFLPTWGKITKIAREKLDTDGNVINGLTWIKQQQEVWQVKVDAVVAKHLKDLAPQLPDRITEKELGLASPAGSGPGAFSFANPSYQALDSKITLIGGVTQRAMQNAREAFSESSAGALTNFAKNQEAVIEWGTLHQKTSRSAMQWGLVDDPVLGRGLVSKKAVAALGREDADVLLSEVVQGMDDGAEHFIPITKDETWELARHHADSTNNITVRRNERGAAFGSDQVRSTHLDADGQIPVFRPIPANPKDYPFFAFVSDPKVTGQGHVSMIHAQTEKELQALVQKAQAARPDLEIRFKKDVEDFYRARQSYEYDRTLSENYIDSSLRNEGVYSSYFTKTDPQKVVDDYVAHHTRLLDTETREIVRAKYQAAFDWIEDQATAYSRVETSKFGGNFDKLAAEGKNPFLSYIKTALNISRMNEHPLWNAANQTADKAVSKVVDTIGQIFGRTRAGQVSSEQLEEVNALLQKHGINTGYYDAATNLLVNNTAPRAELSKFIRGANAVLARLTLALDPLNALVNAVGANILRSTELKQVTDAIKAGDSELAGEIARLGKIDVTGQGDLILSPAKLMAKATGDFVSSDKSELLKLYKSLGIIRDSTEQFQMMLGDLAIAGNESAKVLETRLSAAVEKMQKLSEAGERYTGNKLAEEFNRFISARSMQLLTEPAVSRGIITRQEQYAYMNTFVNRVEGNIIASQRPLVFQGPIGQALGLFQSYQFNLMQQMFRYVSEGSGKDAAMLLGLQGTLFGLQGLPAFQAINQHIIGTASGNRDHRDAYDAIYGIAGKNLGDLLTYGLPSNLLQTNIYSRGDINPRQVTIIPTALNEVPIVGAYTKFFGSLKETAQKIGQGAPVWETLLQGIEHNGISRPLSGLAQTLQATTPAGVPYSTTNKGTILFSNDLMSFATLSRLAGGRPLDEAIVNDGVYRIHSYKQYDRQKMDVLAETVRSSSIMGQEISSDQWTNFSEAYAARGGQQKNFNQFMIKQIKQANTSEAEKIVSQLQNPFAQKMQLLLGGNGSTE